ncbi:hypothetical protein C0Q70_05902 [Pomacea canaliculata]|uniref:Sodium/myo-inositol cotransporter 2 n=1 Tax=Pomacea canaliculata TaxID=400727 RepID=A0A2T7PMH2_POMCA|nr:hypothetical protein C0Q70_05902 [Pomacea canaliculata]
MPRSDMLKTSNLVQSVSKSAPVSTVEESPKAPHLKGFSLFLKVTSPALQDNEDYQTCKDLVCNIGSEHFVGLAGSGAASGIAVANFELGVSFRLCVPEVRAGGLAAVVFTDTFQTVVMLGGAVFLASMAYAKVGGLEALYFKYMEAVPSVLANATTSNSTCGKPRHDAFHLFRDPLNSDLPWPGVLARATLASLWYWCSDQCKTCVG